MADDENPEAAQEEEAPEPAEAAASETSDQPEETGETADGADAEETADTADTADTEDTEETEDAEGTEDAEDAEEPPVVAEHEAMLERLRRDLGDAIVEAESTHGDLVIRVENEAWHRAAEAAKARLDCEYLSFVSAIDWMPRPPSPDEDPDAPSVPVQPKEMTYGVAGSAGRFQLLACVESTDDKHEVIFKTDLDEDDPVAASWTDVYAGADWHERECWEMFGIRFDGHPHLRHLYLPGEFEGHPLRKDYPLLAREVKPWPGLVDPEAMPEQDQNGSGEDSGEDSDSGNGDDESSGGDRGESADAGSGADDTDEGGDAG